MAWDFVVLSPLVLSMSGFAHGAVSPSPPIAATLGTPFSLRASRTAVVRGEGLEVTFTNVDSDSRCPQGVQCVHAGEVVIRVALRRPPDPSEERELRTPSSASEATFLRYRIKLVSVVPYPKAYVAIPADQYEATLTVSLAAAAAPSPSAGAAAAKSPRPRRRIE